MRFGKAFAAAMFLIALAAISGASSTASAQNVLVAPTNVTAANGAQPGEVIVSWDPVPGAAYYRIGWVVYEDYEAAVDAGGDWLETFAFIDISNRGQTGHTISRMTPGERHAFIVASNDSR